MPLGCGEHVGVIYERGGTVPVFDLEKPISFDWERTRDDISLANVKVSAASGCCDQLGGLQTGFHELHLFRDGDKVWEGPVTRLEYNRDTVEVFASDILWVPKNTVLTNAYNKGGTNTAKAGWVMNWLLKDMTFAKDGDPWNMVPNIHWIQGSDDPDTSSAVKAYSMTTWEDFDKYAEDKGMDYTVIGRDIYFWETHLLWRTIEPPLTEQYLPGGLSLVEYGNEFATRVIVTNGNGYYAMRSAPAWALSKYGNIDHVVSSYNEAAGVGAPTAAELKGWGEQAQSTLDNSFPAPVRVRVPENSGLSPEAPYDINDLIAGAWIQVETDSLCRTSEQWHKLDHVNVHEEAGEEVVSITTLVAPEKVVLP